jgi:hypothetical protein
MVMVAVSLLLLGPHLKISHLVTVTVMVMVAVSLLLLRPYPKIFQPVMVTVMVMVAVSLLLLGPYPKIFHRERSWSLLLFLESTAYHPQHSARHEEVPRRSVYLKNSSLENTAYVPQHSARQEVMPGRSVYSKYTSFRTQRTSHDTASAMRWCPEGVSI